ncbi:MAG TPA: ChrR family anti-sigma-E factor [Steroidobacteraceae bacterium]|nr:ChrR family anti-sigma-E factor [Steroidobacteraceae bacterium]
MIQHHPSDQHLLALASGQLDSGRGFVLAAHVERCGACRRRSREFLELGGELLRTGDPVSLGAEAFAQTLQRIEADRAPVAAAAPAAPPAGFPRDALPLLPARLLAGCSAEPWRWIGPGMRCSMIGVPHAARASVFLLKIAPGRTLPRHSHGGTEFTQVLHGAFHDGRSRFDAGDFDETDAQVTHQPVVTDEAECICLAYLDAPLRFEGWIARTAARWTGFRH